MLNEKIKLASIIFGLIALVIFVIITTIVVITKSDKVKEVYEQPITIASNCVIDNNKSVDGSVVLNCKFK